MVSAQSGQCGREREGQNPMGLQYSNRSGNQARKTRDRRSELGEERVYNYRCGKPRRSQPGAEEI